MLPDRVRDGSALALAATILAVGAVILFLNTPDPGFTIVQRDGRLVVGEVTTGGPAYRDGVRPGDAVVAVDGQPSDQAYASFVDPSDPAYDPLHSLFTSANEFAIETDAGVTAMNPRVQLVEFRGAWLGFLLGVLVLAGGIWWMKGGRAGSGLRGPAIPLASAVAIPLLGIPLATAGLQWGAAAAAVFAVLGSLLLADAVVGFIPRGRRRTLVGTLAVVCGIGAMLGPVMAIITGVVWGPGGLTLIWSAERAAAWWLMLAVSLVPMLMMTATQPLPGTPLAAADNPGPLWLVAASCTPAVAMLTQVANDSRDWGASYLILLWVATLVVARAIGRRVNRARRQHDLLVAVTEAERARLAADLHDVALQEVTLLVRHLDAKGDAAGADMARGVSDRLRELCGELHLPILDELGAGPALEWLVEQVSSATGGDLRLERSDPARPPGSVELTVFRVAQEAISNAVKHGGPPIIVRYMTSPSAVTLSVDDAGSGLELERGRIEPRPGHYGLATMQQRAEQIGALLSIRTWPAGGTRVSLEWKVT